MPWFFDNQLLMLIEASEEKQVSEIKFTHTPCWFRVYDLPFAKRNAQFARYIGDNMGGFIMFDDSDPLGLDNFLRIKASINVGKPLRRGIKVATSNDGFKWVDIKYERIGDFCYFCGMLGHIDKDCTALESYDNDKKDMVYKYGPWLRASPLKRNRVPKEELDREIRLSSKLQKLKEDKVEVQSDHNIIKLGPPSLAKKSLIPVIEECVVVDKGDRALDGDTNEVEGSSYITGEDVACLTVRNAATGSKKTGTWKRLARPLKNDMQPHVITGIMGDVSSPKTKKRMLVASLTSESEEVVAEKRLKGSGDLMDTDSVIQVPGEGDACPREEQ